LFKAEVRPADSLSDKILPQGRKGVHQADMGGQKPDGMGHIGRNGKDVARPEPCFLLSNMDHQLARDHIGYLFMGVGVWWVGGLSGAIVKIYNNHHEVVGMAEISPAPFGDFRFGSLILFYETHNFLLF
jgi:hypothetical protein